MIEVLQGSLGSGKSAFTVARAIRHLKEGGVVAANFNLVDGWNNFIAQRTFLGYLFESSQYEKSLSFYNRFFVVKSLDAIKKVDPRKYAIGRHKEVKGKYKEGQGLLILDEAHLLFNSRKWAANFDWIEFLSQSRKLKWDVLIISHSLESVDSQIRAFFEYETRFRNMQKVKWPVIGLPLCPFPLFLSIRRYAGLGPGSGAIDGRDLLPFPKWAYALYDSALVFRSEDAFGSSEPERSGSPPSPPLCGGEGISYPSRSALSLDCLWSRWEKFDEPIELTEYV